MLHKLRLKITKFQLPPPKHLSTVVKHIFFKGEGGGEGYLVLPPCRIGLMIVKRASQHHLR